MLEELTEAFARRGVHWAVRERKCKFKCTAHAAHALVDFDVRVYASSGGAEHVVEFQLKSGCAHAFGGLYVELAKAPRAASTSRRAARARARAGTAARRRLGRPLGCGRRGRRARGRATASTEGDLAAIEQLNALAAMVDDAHADAAGAREAARALAHAARRRARRSRAARVGGGAARALAGRDGATSGGAAVRLAALSLVAHLPSRAAAARSRRAARAARGRRGRAFARVEPLVHGRGARARPRVEAARTRRAARAFPTTLSRGARHALEAACAARRPPARLTQSARSCLVAAH